MPETCVAVVISGTVQGVFFRASAQVRARQLGIRGWVRNRRDGKVEALIQGDDEAVRKMIDWCRHGPPGAHVRKVDVDSLDPAPGLDDFTVERTEY